METSIKIVNAVFGLVFAVYLVNAMTAFKFGTPLTAIPKPHSYVSVENVDRTLSCLAMNIYREAGSESFEGKVGVAQVTLNRVNHGSFPKDVCGVVYQKNVVMEKVVCQFSWHCMGDLKTNINNESFKESYAVAKKVLLEGFRLDSLKDAIYFHAVYIHPSWPHEKVAQIGNHVFYKARTNG